MHVRMLLADARPDLDADTLAEALLAPLAADGYRYQRQHAGRSPERIKGALHVLATALLAS
ncbi:hypothetical protein BH23ACT10_BH23ACT10_36280 [soil metagenome]